MKKIDLQLDFDAICKRIEHHKKQHKPGVWAQMTGVSKNVVANIHGKTKQKPSLEYIIAVARAIGKPVDYLLYGKDSIQTESGEKLSSTVIEHQNLVKKFKDPEKGLKINKRLIKIEELSKAIYEKVSIQIKASYDVVVDLQDSLPWNGVERRKSEDEVEGENERNGTDT
ncbi:MAG: helix-turn-helix transcriptional regulator [Desulfobacteraceae bacterium]|nr:helix-turn-helix transcriptional regulator [Desulfobacteraceae bacterium]